MICNDGLVVYRITAEIRFPFSFRDGMIARLNLHCIWKAFDLKSSVEDSRGERSICDVL